MKVTSGESMLLQSMCFIRYHTSGLVRTVNYLAEKSNGYRICSLYSSIDELHELHSDELHCNSSMVNISPNINDVSLHLGTSLGENQEISR